MSSTQKYWVWQREEWGVWSCQHYRIAELVESVVRSLSQLKSLSLRLNQEDISKFEYELTVVESLDTSSIEGRILDRDSVRSAVAKQLGLESFNPSSGTRDVEGLISALHDATSDYRSPLSEERLHRWHAGLFPNGRDERGFPVQRGVYRKGQDPMQVITDKGNGRTFIHYTAPPSENVPIDMATFFSWFNHPDKSHSLVRAAIAVHWFVSIHPYEDGNGRLCRLIADLAVAQSETTSSRLYSLSNTLKEQPQLLKEYYRILEACQRGEEPIDTWICFFITALGEAATRALKLTEKYLYTAYFWDHIRDITLNERQRKFLDKFLSSDDPFNKNITHKIYQKIVNHNAPATNKRDLKYLLDNSIIETIETTGRNAAYRLRPL